MVAVASLPAENILSTPLSRLREVASRRRAETETQRKKRAKQEEDLIAAQEALHRRVDGEAVSSQSSERMKDRIIFLARTLCPESDNGPLRSAVGEIAKDERLPKRGVTEINEGIRDVEEEAHSAFRLQVEDQKEDRRSDFLSILYANAGELGDDYDAFCREKMCRALLRGYRSFQSFASLLAQYTTEPVPTVQTVNNALRCIDGDCDDLTYMETLERWLPEIIPVAVALLTTYADAVRAERAANGSEPVLTRSIVCALSIPKRGTSLSTIARRILNTYAVVQNRDAVSKAFKKDVTTVTALLKESGVYQSHGGARKKSAY